MYLLEKYLYFIGCVVNCTLINIFVYLFLSSRVMTYREHDSWVAKVKVPACGNGKVVSVATPGDIKFWDIKAPESLRTIGATSNSNVTALDIHNHANIIAW